MAKQGVEGERGSIGVGTSERKEPTRQTIIKKKVAVRDRTKEEAHELIK
jgi:hypothetical protein